MIAQYTNPFGRIVRKTLRAATVGLASFGLVASVAAAESPSATGLIDDNSYESPTYGYTIEWDGDWIVSERDVTSERGVDSLVLNGPASQVLVMSIPTEYGEEALVSVFGEGLTGGDEFEVLDEGERNGATYQQIQFEGEQSGTLIAYIEAEEIIEAGGPSDPAVLRLTALLAKEASFEDRMDAAIDDIELDGDSAFRSLDGGAADDDARDDDARDDEDRGDDEDRDDADKPSRGRAGDEVNRGDSSEDEDERGSRGDRDRDEDEDEDDEDDRRA